MEQMEVTPVPLDDDDDDNGNINTVISNPRTTSEVNYFFDPSVDAIAMQSENNKSCPPVTEGVALGTKTSNSNSVHGEGEKLQEICQNIQLSNDDDDDAEGNTETNIENASKRNDGTVRENNESYKSAFHFIDETCLTKCVINSSSENPTVTSREKVRYNVCTADKNAADFAVGRLSGNSTISDFSKNTQISMAGATKMFCEEQTVQSCKKETECNLNKCDAVKKEYEVTGKQFQFDSLQKQASEIKERVMGFLTKYTNTDEASCNGQISAQTCSEQDCVKGNQSQVVIDGSIASEGVLGEKCDPLNFRKILNDMTQNTMESASASPQTQKLQFGPVSKSSVIENFSQTSNIDLLADNTSTQLKDAVDQQMVCTTFASQAPSQSRCAFNILKNESLLSTSVSTSCEKKYYLKTSKDVMERNDPENTLDSNTDVCLLQPKNENTLKSFELEMLGNCQSFNSKSNLQRMSVSGTPAKSAVGMRQQNELNISNTSFEILPPCKDVFGSKVEGTSSQKNVIGPSLNTVSVNQTFTSQRSTITHTTSSINSPILSSKSSNDPSSLNYTPFSNGSTVSNIWAETGMNNTESGMCSAKNSSKSRRTKSSDAMLYNIPNSVSNGGTTFPNNTNSKSQKYDISCLRMSEEIDETNLTPFRVPEKSSNMSFIPQNNININSPNSIVNFLEKSTTNASEKALPSDYKCFEKTIANYLSKGNMENPFIKKPPIESIGLFKSPEKSAVSEIENSAFESASPLLHSLKIREKAERCIGISGISKPTTSNEPLVFPMDIKNKQDQTSHTETEFTFGSVCSTESLVPTNKQTLNCGRISSEDISEQTPFGKAEGAPSQLNSNSLFKFTFTPEKSKTFCPSRVTWSRSSKKSFRIVKQVEKVPLKGNSTSNDLGKGTEDILFKPAYGSDVKFEKGIYKNVIVRYQNIVFMDDYANVSPEELRSQFYAKPVISGPFKFGGYIDSHEYHSIKKTQNQEIQTDEHFTTKNPDLAAIWRVLECPVCLDVVLPPVYQCEQGHHACASCWTKVLTCPLCKRPQSCTRNYMAEALVEQVPLPCRYHIEGCKETVQHNSKVSHEESCSYRMFQCPVPKCNQAHSYQNMCKHFKKHHKSILHHEGHSVGKGEKFCDVLYKEALLSSLIHAFDITKWGLFFLREITVGRSTAFFVQVMPAASDQAVYFYHLEVCDHHDCRKECFKGRVFPMCKPSQEIIDQEEYLCLSELILKTVKKTTPLKIVVTIWQLKPAFTLSS